MIVLTQPNNKELLFVTFKGKYYQATGSRKRAKARVRLFLGNGQLLVNGKDYSRKSEEYLAPLNLVGKAKNFNISINIKGGGIESQKEAARNAIARALVVYDQKLKTTLRKAGYLTRDSREKERKKPGLKRARRAPQWQKR